MENNGISAETNKAVSGVTRYGLKFGMSHPNALLHFRFFDNSFGVVLVGKA